jgi:hypothetical protein
MLLRIPIPPTHFVETFQLANQQIQHKPNQPDQNHARDHEVIAFAALRASFIRKPKPESTAIISAATTTSQAVPLPSRGLICSPALGFATMTENDII